MTDQQPNWADAPADATHYLAGAPLGWRKVNDHGDCFAYDIDRHEWYSISGRLKGSYIPRPNTGSFEELDWRQAPADATHVLIGADRERQWRKIEGDTVRAWTGGQWRIVGALPMDRYIARPAPEQVAVSFAPDGKRWDTFYLPSLKSSNAEECRIISAPTWSGQDLPPVGTVCEKHWGRGIHYDVLILAHDEDLAVFRWIHGERKGEYSASPDGFRPILTAEQRAAAERREAIAAMLTDAEVDPFESAREESMAGALYDAGWRKMEGK